MQNLQALYWVVGLAISSTMCVLGILSFVLGRQKGRKETEDKLKNDSYNEGVKDTTIKNSIDNLAKKIEDYAKDTVHQKEFMILEQSVVNLQEEFKKDAVKQKEFMVLEQRVKVLQKATFNKGGVASD